MGYTHYWEIPKELDADKWNNFIADFNKVLPNFIDVLDTSGDQKLLVDSEVIYFNGIGDDAHETFVINRAEASDFEFCKTARKPYDIAVCSALIIAKRHFGDDFKISSDGSNAEDEWTEAKILCKDVLGYGNLDLGDRFQDTDGKWKVRNPETLGQLLDPVGEIQQ